MTCERARERMAEFLAGELDEGLCAQLRGHLNDCPSCAAEAEGLKELWDSLGRIPEEYPGHTMRQRFDAMLAAYQAGMRQAELSRPGLGARLAAGWRRWWPERPALQFAATAAVLLLGVALGRLVPAAGRSGDDVGRMRGELREMRQLLALSLLEQQSASQRLEGVNWSVRVEPGDGEVLSALLSTVNSDPNVNVRLAAVDALRYFARSPAARRGLSQALVNQDSPLVEIAIIGLLNDLGDRQAAPALRALLQREGLDDNVRRRAGMVLGRLEAR